MAWMHRYHITSQSANISILKTCLTYLHYFESPFVLTAKGFHEFPLLKYAVEFWPSHYRCITDDADREAADVLGFDFVQSQSSCFINWVGISNSLNLLGLNVEGSRIGSPLYYMSYLGVSGVVHLFLNNGANVSDRGGTYGTALSTASRNGHEEVIRLLLKRGPTSMLEA